MTAQPTAHHETFLVANRETVFLAETLARALAGGPVTVLCHDRAQGKRLMKRLRQMIEERGGDPKLVQDPPPPGPKKKQQIFYDEWPE